MVKAFLYLTGHSSPSTRTVTPEHQQRTGVRIAGRLRVLTFPSHQGIPKCPSKVTVWHQDSQQTWNDQSSLMSQLPTDVLMQRLLSSLLGGKQVSLKGSKNSETPREGWCTLHLFLLHNLRAVPKSLAVDTAGCHRSTEKQPG